MFEQYSSVYTGLFLNSFASVTKHPPMDARCATSSRALSELSASTPLPALQEPNPVPSAALRAAAARISISVFSMRTPTTLRFHRPSSRYARASNTGPYSSAAECDELHPKMSKFITISSLEANHPLRRTCDPRSYHVRHRGLVVARRDKSLGHCSDCGTKDGAGARLVAREECPGKRLVRAQRVNTV